MLKKMAAECISAAGKYSDPQGGVTDMMQHTIITIGRQFGSGGHEVGNQLSERLNIRFMTTI